MSEAWLQLAPADGLSQLTGQWTRYPHDTHTTPTLGGGDGGYGISGVVHGGLLDAYG
jgi:hypothetical protein